MSTAAVRTLDHPAREEIRLEAVLHALADPMRLHAVRSLAEMGEGTPVSCSAIDLAVSKSTTTHHFRVLREAGVISQVYQGTAKMNALRRHDLEELFPGLLDTVLTAADAQCRRLTARFPAEHPAPGSPSQASSRAVPAV